MSWRDSASGSSDWHGGGDTAGNSGTRGAGTGGNNSGGGGVGSSWGGSMYSRTGGQGGGLTTGKTIHGNTAFGQSGGMAQGHATAKLGAGAGQHSTTNTYSNFRKTDGTPMFSGAVQGMGIRAPNANVAAAALRALQQQAQAATQRVGGLLSDEGVTTGPIGPLATPTVVPTSIPPEEATVPYDETLANFQPWWNSPVQTTFTNPYNAHWGIANGPVWSSGFPTRQHKGDQENLDQSKGDLPSNIHSFGNTYGIYR